MRTLRPASGRGGDCRRQHKDAGGGSMKIQPRSPPLSLSSYDEDTLVGADVVGRALGISARQVLRLGIPVVDLGLRSKRFRIGAVRQFIVSRTRDETAA